MKKKVINIILCTLLLSGCVKDYTTKDVKKLIKEKYNIHFKVLNDGIEQEGEDGYTDTLWTLYDEDNDVTFHVLDNVYWGMETATNSLQDDYEDQIFLKYAEKLDGLEYKTTLSDGLTNVYIESTFTNRDGIKQIFKQLKKLQKQVSKKGFSDLSISYYLDYDHPLRNVVKDYEVSDGDSHGYLSMLEEEDLQYFENNYLYCALDYSYQDAINEFTSEEITNFITTDKDVYRIKIADVWQEDLVGSKYAYGVSFSTLYQILVRERYTLTGDANHYSFVAKDGSTYEISYDFVDYNKGYYYYKDNVKTNMSAAFYNHFTKRQLQDMFNLDVTVEKYSEEKG